MQYFDVELTGLAVVRQRRQVLAQTGEAAIAHAVQTAGDHLWQYEGVEDDTIDGMASNGSHTTHVPAAVVLSPADTERSPS